MMRKSVVFIVSFAAMYALSGATYYAKPDGSDEASCLDVENAGSISNAFAKAQASAGNELVLSDGDYDCAAITNSGGVSFKIVKSITMRSASGNRAACRLIGGGAGAVNTAFYITATGTTTVRDLTVTNFMNSSTDFHIRGTDKLTHCIVSNCLFTTGVKTGNGAFYRYYKAGDLKIYNTRVENYASTASYAIWYAWGGGITAYDCEFVGNYTTASNHGTGCSGGSCYGCYFSGNYASGGGGNGKGGAVQSTTCSNCVFEANKGPGMISNSTIYDSVVKNQISGSVDYEGVFHRCVFSNNACQISSSLGGAYNNCLFVSNSLYTTQKVALLQGAVRNCTFVGNDCPPTSAWNGGGMLARNTKAWNCIFAENGNSRLSATTPASGSYAYLTNCIVSMPSGAKWGSNIGTWTSVAAEAVDSKIKFLRTGDHPYAIARKSIAVDAGTNTVGWTAGTTDIAGNRRVVTCGRGLDKDPGAIVDIGCYENQEKTPGLFLLVR